MEREKPRHPGGRPRLDPSAESRMKVRSIRLYEEDWQWLDAQKDGPGAFIREAVRRARAKQARAKAREDLDE